MTTCVKLWAAALLLFVSAAAIAQQAEAPDPGYVPAPEFFQLPPNMNFGVVSAVAINSGGNIFVLHRGQHRLMEFDSADRYRRGLGDGLFERPHGLRIDAEDNIWTADGAARIVLKFNPQGRIVMVLGVRGSPGDGHPYGHLRAFTEPNDIGFTPNDNFYITQGHAGRILKLDLNGKPLGATGSQGKAPGQYGEAHFATMSARGDIFVADSLNWRMQRLVKR